MKTPMTPALSNLAAARDREKRTVLLKKKSGGARDRT